MFVTNREAKNLMMNAVDTCLGSGSISSILARWLFKPGAIKLDSLPRSTFRDLFRGYPAIIILFRDHEWRKECELNFSDLEQSTVSCLDTAVIKTSFTWPPSVLADWYVRSPDMFSQWDLFPNTLAGAVYQAHVNTKVGIGFCYGSGHV